jgi:hypothetical protein
MSKGKVRDTPMGREIISLLRKMDHPLTHCAADVILELKAEIKWFEQECSASYDETNYTRLKRHLNEIMDDINSQEQIRGERLEMLDSRIVGLELLSTYYETEIERLKSLLGGEVNGSAPEGAQQYREKLDGLTTVK